MRHVTCDYCGEDRVRLFAQRPQAVTVLHAQFERCDACGFIYADPRATAGEAHEFYRATPPSDLASASAEGWRGGVLSRRRHLDLAIVRLAKTEHIRFLEIGFGDGSALAAATELGWEAHGVEYGELMVQAARERLGLPGIRSGDIVDIAYPTAFFDVVYAWHVVEHVLDINSWLTEIARILRPGGVLVLGTENADCAYGTLWTLPFRLAGRTPWPPTSTDHTYWFSRRILEGFLRRHGFADVSVSAYENTPWSIARAQRLRTLRNPRWLYSLLLYLIAATLSQIRPRLGGKLVAVARRAT